jgi:hypothetical protein
MDHLKNPSLPQLLDAAEKLKPLLDQIAFVGGCVTGLLITDLEDIVTVIDGRAEITKEVSTVEPNVRQYLRSEFRSLLETRDFLEALPGQLLPDAASQSVRAL